MENAPWKGSPVFPVEISQWQICVPFTDLLSYYQFHAFRGLLSGPASLEWDLWQMERADEVGHAPNCIMG